MANENPSDDDSSVLLLPHGSGVGKGSAKTRRILVIEDDAVDFAIVDRCLSNTRDFSFHLDQAERLDQGLQKLSEEQIHVVLLDLGLPDSRGLDTFLAVHSCAPDIPIIVLTGLENEAAAFESLLGGAQDYLIKGQFNDEVLIRSLRYAMTRHRTQVRLAHALKQVRESEENLRNVILNNLDGILVVDRFGIIQFSNRAAQEIYGCGVHELEQEAFGFPYEPGDVKEVEIHRRDGEIVPAEIRVGQVEWGGRMSRLVTLRDLRERKQNEADRAQLMAIVGATEDTVMSADLNGTILSWNAGAEKMFGYPASDVIGRHVSMISIPEESNKAASILARVAQGEAVVQEEGICVRQDGSRLHVAVMVSPITDSRNVVIGAAATVRDVTFRKLAEEELRANEERFRSVTESAPDAIVLTNGDGEIVSWNPAAERMFGYLKEEVLGEQVFVLMPERYRDAHQRGFERYKTSGQTDIIGGTIELHGRRRDGTEFPVELSLSNWCTSEGEFYGASIRDITSRKEAETDHLKRLQAERELYLKEEEIRFARKVQKTLFPKKAPSLPGFDIAGAVFPAEQTTGDYFDFIPLKDGSLGLVVADVSGHGLGPALLTAQAQAYLRSLAKYHDDLGEILTRTNGLLLAHETGHFIELFLASIQANSRSFVFASAGHRGFVLNRSGHAETLPSTGPVLAIVEDRVIETAPAITLSPGDVVLLPTDGFYERRSPDESPFGIDRMLDVVRTHRDRPAADIILGLRQSVKSFACGARQQDDETAIVVKVLDSP